MLDPGAINNLGVGGALLMALWLVLKYKPWKNGNSTVTAATAATAAATAAAVLDARIRAIVCEENEALMADIRTLLESRNMIVREKVTDPIIAAIEKSRHDMRNVVSEAIANAYREGKRRSDE